MNSAGAVDELQHAGRRVAAHRAAASRCWENRGAQVARARARCWSRAACGTKMVIDQRARLEQRRRGEHAGGDERARAKNRRARDPVGFVGQHAAHRQVRVPRRTRIADLERRAGPSRSFSTATPNWPSRALRAASVVCAGSNAAVADQRPRCIDRLQLHELPLARRRDQHRAHRHDIGDPCAARAEPSAQRVWQRLRATLHLDVAAENARAVRSEAALDALAQRADGGDRGDAEGEAAQHDPQPRMPPRSSRRAKRNASIRRRDRRRCRTMRSQRAANAGSWVISTSVVAEPRPQCRTGGPSPRHRCAVEVAGRLVCQQEARPRREGAGECHTLLLAAR